MSDLLDKKILIAMPGMLDDMFADTTVLICAHSDEGAMGLITNKLSDELDFSQLVSQIDLWSDDETPPASFAPRDCPVHTGGPVDPSRGFVLHSPDYFTKGASVKITKDICLTATVDILRAMACGGGPRHVLLALGYAAWAPGQLEDEIQANGWLHTEATPNLVFGTPVHERYGLAFSGLGIDPSFLTTSAGHA